MREQLTWLYRLQQIDSRTRADQAELAGLDDGTALANELAKKRAALEELEHKFAQTQAQLHDRQLELQGAEDDRKRRWGQAYGGVVSDPKELSALERKIEELDRRRDKLEENIIMLLDEVEALEAEVGRERAEVARVAAEVEQVRARFTRRSAELATELTTLAGERAELAEKVQANCLAEYEYIRDRNSNVAVAMVVKHACSACHTSVAGSLLAELHAPSRLVKCESCKRILVLDEWV